MLNHELTHHWHMRTTEAFEPVSNSLLSSSWENSQYHVVTNIYKILHINRPNLQPCYFSKLWFYPKPSLEPVPFSSDWMSMAHLIFLFIILFYFCSKLLTLLLPTRLYSRRSMDWCPFIVSSPQVVFNRQNTSTLPKNKLLTLRCLLC